MHPLASPEHGISCSLGRITPPQIGAENGNPSLLHPGSVGARAGVHADPVEPAAAFILGRPLATCVPLRPAFNGWETLPPQSGHLSWLLDWPKGSPDVARIGIAITATKEDDDGPTGEEIERYDAVYVSP